MTGIGRLGETAVTGISRAADTAGQTIGHSDVLAKLHQLADSETPGIFRGPTGFHASGPDWGLSFDNTGRVMEHRVEIPGTYGVRGYIDAARQEPIMGPKSQVVAAPPPDKAMDLLRGFETDPGAMQARPNWPPLPTREETLRSLGLR